MSVLLWERVVVERLVIEQLAWLRVTAGPLFALDTQPDKVAP